MIRRGFVHQLLTPPFRFAIHTQRIGRIVLGIGRWFPTIENKVGAEMHHPGTAPGADARQQARGLGIDEIGEFALDFAIIHRSGGGGIDQHLEIEFIKNAFEGIEVREIQCPPLQHPDLKAAIFQEHAAQRRAHEAMASQQYNGDGSGGWGIGHGGKWRLAWKHSITMGGGKHTMKFFLLPALLWAAHSSAAEKPTFESFMGINGHTVQFKPELYRPICRLVRDYHPVEWDLGKDSSSTPPFPFAANRVSWEQVYGSWVKGGWTVDACLMFETLPRDQWKKLPEDAFAYGKEFAAAFGPAGKYPFVQSVEIGNEPGKFSDADYRIVLENMAKGLRAGDPKLLIATCNLIVGKSHDYAKSVDCLVGLEKFYDILNLHIYAELKPWPTWERSHPEDASLPHYRRDIQALCDWRDQYAAGKPIWITEFGFDASTKQPDPKGDFAKWIGNTETEQALWNVRSWLIFSALPVERAYVYFFNDDDQPQMHGSSGLTRNFVPKPAFWAAAHLQKTLGKFRFHRSVLKKAEDTMIYEFKHDNDLIWAAWSPTRSGDAHEIELPKFPGTLSTSERLSLKDAPGEAVKVNGQKLEVSGTPIFLHFKS